MKHFKLLSLFLLSILFLTACNSDKEPTDLIVGKWQRTDGSYIIKINSVHPEGYLDALYFNPDSIHVGRTGWRIDEEKLQLYVELRDVNYPGSIYQLTYDEQSDKLTGTYYQAVSRQTYKVTFLRKQ